MITISPNIRLDDNEVEFEAIRSGGPGGQHVNKTSTAIHLRFDVNASSLPREVKQRLLRSQDKRITKERVIVIKAQEERSQLRNREEALERLKEMIRPALRAPKKRVPTKPRKSAVRKRLDNKTKRGQTKQLRKPPQS